MFVLCIVPCSIRFSPFALSNLQTPSRLRHRKLHVLNLFASPVPDPMWLAVRGIRTLNYFSDPFL